MTTPAHDSNKDSSETQVFLQELRLDLRQLLTLERGEQYSTVEERLEKLVVKTEQAIRRQRGKYDEEAERKVRGNLLIPALELFCHGTLRRLEEFGR